MKSNGGVDIPLIYVFIYEKNEIHTTTGLCLYPRSTFEPLNRMEQYKIYEDEQYVCYDVSDLFYSDLRSMWKAWLGQRSDVYLTSWFGNEFRTFIPTIGITWEHFSVIELTRGAEQQRM